MNLFETPRLLARQLTPMDVESMYSIYGDPVITRWMGDGSSLPRELCKKWIEVSIKNYETKGFGVSAVIEKETGAFIGCCGIVYDPERQEPEIIYAFEQASWGKGYASELIPAMLQYGLDQCRLPYILATINEENKASQRVVEKSGMKFVEEETEEDGHRTFVYRIEKSGK
ncbi:MAG TPA: GNAT family N-acetyltransferase [Anaerolineales bacterium]|nr:GNAT family N-acetyltransferase [Anaerolineales bacterium]